jgi:hypothetical protein
MTSPTKKSGRCQTWRDRPVCSMIATTSHAIRKPSAPTISIQGTNTSENLSSGRFSAPVKRPTNCDLPTILIVRFVLELNMRVLFLIEPLVALKAESRRPTANG